MTKTVLFDLDGTLLPMDQDAFVKDYFSRLARKAAPLGYEPKALINAVWAGTAAMVKNDGARTNEEVFWARFAEFFGERVYRDVPFFEEFYRTEFQAAKASCGFSEEAGKIVTRLSERGTELVLASNPVFPLVAQRSRLSWAGVDPSLFRHFTSYENSRFCKPNPAYYAEICSALGLDPSECLMVGNDAEEDLAAAQIGMAVFLVTPCLINRAGKDVSSVPQGTLADLGRFLFG